MQSETFLTCQDGFSAIYFQWRQKTGESLRQSENYKSFHSMLTLQGMEGFYSHFKKTAFYATTFLNNESVPPFFHDCSQNNIRFLWSSNLYKFFCLCFGIRSAPKIFTKLLKIPIATLYRIIIIHIIYLDDIMLIGKNLEEILLKQDTLIFLL